MSKLILPAAALEQHTAVLGKTGSGKTYTAKAVIVEPLLERAAHVGLVDPTDAWWGLRSSRDGKGAGYPVLVLGGPHGDLPLPANGGEAVARLLIEQRVNLIACTKGLTVGERTRWAIAFFGTINRLNQRPLYLVVDEAHQFAPQGKVPDPDTGRMLHEVNTLASGGRGIGVRLTMITQRPQKLHKDTLTCADTLIALRVLAPHDRDAVKAWIDGCGDPAQGKQVLDSLAQLKRGEGWVWYPEGAHLERSKFPQIKTFDSSATPQAGHEVAAPKKAAEVNLDAIRTALADAVKEAEANDPKLLRAQLAAKDAELSKLRKAAPSAPASDPKAIEQAEQRGYASGRADSEAALRTAAASVGSSNAAIAKASTELATVQLRLYGAADAAKAAQIIPKKITSAANLTAQAPRSVSPPQSRSEKGTSSADGVLAKVEIAFLTALAQQGRSLTRNQVAIFSGYSAKSRHVDNTLASLRTKQLIEGGGDAIRITSAGVWAIGNYEPLPTGAALRAYWQNELDKASSAFLGVICDAYPGTLTREEVAEKANYSPTSRHVDNTLAQLRTRELVTGNGKAIRASEELFDA